MNSTHVAVQVVAVLVEVILQYLLFHNKLMEVEVIQGESHFILVSLNLKNKLKLVKIFLKIISFWEKTNLIPRVKNYSAEGLTLDPSHIKYVVDKVK